jgi:deoxyguanosine kinase
MNDVVLALGTNLGNRTENLQQALNYINILIGPVIKQSKIYETKAVGFDGHDFLNMTVLIQTDQMPDVLLKKTQSIEKLLGRTKKSQNQIYQNRLIDIDILYFNNHIFKSDNLTIPHPNLHLRNFVLYPLADILPNFSHPLLHKSHKELLTLSPDKSQPIETDNILNINHLPYNFIAIEGNIGAGKTTFATQFAKDVNAKLVLERFEENPFLPKFYEDPKRYAFPLEMSFLADRYQQLTDDLSQYDLFKTSVISDYFVFKSLIFSKVTLSEEEYALYRKIFNFMYKDLVKPDLYIYLYQNTERLLQNIKKRGRSYEQSITGDYLEQIHEGYMNFIKTQTDLNILILDISDIDFVKNPEMYDEMLARIVKHSQKNTNEHLSIQKI